MNEFSQADELAQWQAPFRKTVHFFWQVQDQEQTVGLMLPILCLYKNRFCIGVTTWYFQAVICPKIIIAVRPMVGFHQIHCSLSPFLQNLLFLPAGHPHVVPSPISRAKQFRSLLDAGHAEAPLYSFSRFQMGFKSIKKLEKCKNP